MQDAEEIGVKNDLLNLLKLLIDNIGELVSDDQWLKGQVALVKTVISGRIEKEMLVDAKRSLKEVVCKQSLLKNSLAEAKSNFKKMIAIFIERLSNISDTTGQYHSKIESYAENLSQTDDISQISHIIEGLMSDTHTIQVDFLSSREPILTQQDQAIATV
jgi:diguanylate cyclase